MAGSGLAMTSFAPLAKALRKAFTAAGFSLIILGVAMITLPYSFTPCAGKGSTTMSSAFTPRASRFSRLVKLKPVMASMSPRTSMVSRSGGSMLVHCTPLMLLALAKIGKALRPASKPGAPSFLPFRSDGLVMPLFLSASTAAGVLL